MNEYIISFSSGITFFTVLLFFFSYLSIHFKGSFSEKLYYILTIGILYGPIVTYTIQLIKIVLNQNINPERILDNFYIEWILTTPLILIQLMRIINIRLSMYLIFLFVDIVMILSGYIYHLCFSSFVSNSNGIFEKKDFEILGYTFLGIASASYITLLSFLYYLYFTFRKRVFSRATLTDPITVQNSGAVEGIKSRKTRLMILETTFSLRVYKILIVCLTLTWSLYPMLTLLQKYNILSILQTVIGYIVLDGMSKGIFSIFLILSREILVRDTPFLNFCRRKVFKVHPGLILPENGTISLSNIQREISTINEAKSLDSIDEALRTCESV